MSRERKSFLCKTWCSCQFKGSELFLVFLKEKAPFWFTVLWIMGLNPSVKFCLWSPLVSFVRALWARTLAVAFRLLRAHAALLWSKLKFQKLWSPTRGVLSWDLKKIKTFLWSSLKVITTRISWNISAETIWHVFPAVYKSKSQWQNSIQFLYQLLCNQVWLQKIQLSLSIYED